MKEKAVTDSGERERERWWRGRRAEREARRGNRGREPSRCSQHDCLLGCGFPARGMDDTAAATTARELKGPVTNMLPQGTTGHAWAVSDSAS